MKNTPTGGRRLIWIVFGLVVGLATVVLLLPTVLSSGWARARVLASVSERVPGEVSMADWSLGWFRGLAFDGIHYADTAGNSVTIRSVRVSRGLFAIIRTRDLGTMVVHDPHARITPPRPDDKAESSPRERGRPSEPVSSPPPVSPSDAPASFGGIPVTGILRVDGGRIELMSATGGQVLLQDVEFSIDFSDATGPLTWSVVAKGGADGGVLTGSVSGTSENLTARFDMDIAKAMDEAGKFFDLGGWKAGGTAALRANIRPKAGVQMVSAELDVRDVALSEDSKIVFSDPNVVLGLDATLDNKRDDPRLQIEKLSLVSEMVALDARGALENMSTTRDLTLDGTVATDMKRIETYIKHSTETEFEIEGKSQKPFHLQMSLTEKTPKEMLITVLAEAGVYADRFQFFGIELTKLDVPVAVSNSVARMDLTSDMNQGRVEVRPRIDLNADVPAVVFPDQSKVLDGVALTDAIADGLLGRFSPLFKGAVVLGGSVSMTFESFRFPLDPSWTTNTAFSGEIELRGVKLGAGGLLQELLQIMKATRQVADIGDRNIAFVCEDGWLRTSPLTIKIDGHDVSLSGAVGMDQTLRYGVTIPLTVDLVGRDVVKYLGSDSEVTLPIGGHVTKPKIDRSNLQNEIVRLGKIAAKNAVAEALTESLFGKPEKSPAQATDGQNGEGKPLSTEDQLKEELEKKAGELLKGLFKN